MTDASFRFSCAGPALLLACAAAATGVAPAAIGAQPPPPRHSTKTVAINDDGFSAFFNGSYKSIDDVRQRILSHRDSPVAVLEWCVTGGSRVNYPSQISELIGEGLTAFPRRGDKHVYETLRRIAVAKGTGCAVYFGEEAVLSGHDLTAKEDRLIAAGQLVRPKRDRLSPGQYRTRAAQWHAMGADGVHLFNTFAREDIRAAAGLPVR